MKPSQQKERTIINFSALLHVLLNEMFKLKMTSTHTHVTSSQITLTTQIGPYLKVHLIYMEAIFCFLYKKN